MQRLGILLVAVTLLSGCAYGSFSDGNMTARYVRWGDQQLNGFSVKGKGVNATLESQKASGLDIKSLQKVLEAASTTGAL